MCANIEGTRSCPKGQSPWGLSPVRQLATPIDGVMWSSGSSPSACITPAMAYTVNGMLSQVACSSDHPPAVGAYPRCRTATIHPDQTALVDSRANSVQVRGLASTTWTWRAGLWSCVLRVRSPPRAPNAAQVKAGSGPVRHRAEWSPAEPSCHPRPRRVGAITPFRPLRPGRRRPTDRPTSPRSSGRVSDRPVPLGGGVLVDQHRLRGGVAHPSHQLAQVRAGVRRQRLPTCRRSRNRSVGHAGRRRRLHP